MTELRTSPFTGEHMTLAEYQWLALLKAGAQVGADGYEAA